MDSRRIDRILLVLGALLIVISSYQLFFINSGRGEGVVLGTLTSTLSVVKTKGAMALDWRDAVTGNELTENQLIFTDNLSRADVTFKSGSSLSIGESSLVKLKSTGKDETLDLSKGFIRAKLDGNKPLTIKMNGEDYLVSGDNADIQINLSHQKGEIGVVSGNVKVEAHGVTEKINTDTALVIDGEKLSKKVVYFKTLTPAKSEVKYVKNLPTSVAFTWEPAETATIHLSQTSSMESAKTTESASGTVLPLGPGLYYFKIESEKGSSLVTPFRIVEETIPEIIRPINGSQVEILEDADSSLLLQWKNDQKLKYLLEWDDEILHSAQVSGSSSLVKINASGIFKWRIRIFDEHRPEALWTEWQELKLDLITLPSLPTDLIPHEVEYQTYETPEEKIDFMWKAGSAVEMEIETPDKKLISQKITENFFSYTATQTGIYQWRLRGVDNHLRNSDWTEWKTFHIEDLSQQKNAEGIQRIQLKKPDQSVTFKWKSSDSESTIFELAKDQNFKTMIKKMEVNSDSAKVNIPVVGSYYWRSRQFKKDGTFNVSEPKKVIIEPVAAPLKPEKFPDMKIPIQKLPTTTGILQELMNFIISSAYADELKGQIHVDLPIKEEAKAYNVRIFKDEALSELVYETTTQTKVFEWKDAQPGNYYWQYAVIDFWDRKSPYSDPAVLVITGNLSEFPEKPKLLSPIRAKEIGPEALVLSWTPSEKNKNYVVEISETEDFAKILSTKKSKKAEADFTNLKLEPKLHYWRVKAYNANEDEVISNTGRFTLKPSLEKTQFIDHTDYQKIWKSRGFIAWAPSKDNYTFKDGATGKIDGTAMLGALISGTKFNEHSIFNAELLRQTGKVYKSETYLFQRLLIDYIKSWNINPGHKWGVGLAVGQSSGQAYEIGSGNAVTSKAVSGLSYGPVLRNYLSINQNWEMQGRFLYLLGEIKQMEVGADLIKRKKNYLMLGGLGMAMREYELSSGKQTSLKVSLGIGKEF